MSPLFSQTLLSIWGLAFQIFLPFGATVAPPHPSGNVVFDNAAYADWSATGTLTHSMNVVIGNGQNRAAIILAGSLDRNNNWSAVKLGGVTATSIPNADVSGTAGYIVRLTLFCVANPPSGTQPVSISWTGSSPATFIGVISASGVNQVTPCNNGVHTFDASTSAKVSCTVTSNPGDLTSSAADSNNQLLKSGSPTNQTLRYLAAINHDTGGDTGPGTGTTTHTWTNVFPNSNEDLLCVGANFVHN